VQDRPVADHAPRADFAREGLPHMQEAEVAASNLVQGLSTANIQISYLNHAGTALADPVGNYGDIAYVRAQIVNFQHQLLIPLFTSTFATPAFASTLPRESLGVSKDGITPC
jgi:hypothetical protein